MYSFAMLYFVALMLTLVVCIGSHQRPRIIGAGYLVGSWLAVMAVTMGGNFAPTVIFSFIDTIALTGFVALWAFYQRPWALVVAVFHVLMLFTHLGYEMTTATNGLSNATQFMYLSILAILGYLCMVSLIWSPILDRTLGRDGEDFGYRASLPLWGFTSRMGSKEEGSRG